MRRTGPCEAAGPGEHMGFWPISQRQLSQAKGGRKLGSGREQWEVLGLPPPLVGYSLAVVLAVFAQIARIPLHPQTALPLITYVPVIALSAWFSGPCNDGPMHRRVPLLRH